MPHRQFASCADRVSCVMPVILNILFHAQSIWSTAWDRQLSGSEKCCCENVCNNAGAVLIFHYSFCRISRKVVLTDRLPLGRNPAWFQVQKISCPFLFYFAFRSLLLKCLKIHFPLASFHLNFASDKLFSRTISLFSF